MDTPTSLSFTLLILVFHLFLAASVPSWLLSLLVDLISVLFFYLLFSHSLSFNECPTKSIMSSSLSSNSTIYILNIPKMGSPFKFAMSACTCFKSVVNLARLKIISSCSLLFTLFSILSILAYRFTYGFKAFTSIQSTNGWNYLAQAFKGCLNFF